MWYVAHQTEDADHAITDANDHEIDDKSKSETPPPPKKKQRMITEFF
jgi:hypothetical protein